MRILRVLLAPLLLAVGLGAVSASPAQAAIPNCTSWTTYYAAYTTAYVVHVPTAGYYTGTVNCLSRTPHKNDAVTVLQRGLRFCHGYNITVDGEYGPQTRSAVLGIQRWANGAYGAGLEEDGEYGPETQNWVQFPVHTWPANTRTNRCEHSPVW
jgi:hypothetical protein